MGAMGGAGNIIFQSLGGPVERYKKQKSCEGGAQRPVLRVNEPKRTGARSAQACTRGPKPTSLLD